VEEAQAGQSRADFISKYNIALKEARETLYWLRLLDASGELSNGSCNLLLKEADEIARVIASIIVRTKKEQEAEDFYFCLFTSIKLPAPA
jgi:four helix bundle protein